MLVRLSKTKSISKLSKMLIQSAGLGLFSSSMNQFRQTYIVILIRNKERPSKTNFMLAKLRAVLVSAESDFALCLVNFGFFLKMSFYNSALCCSVRSLTQCCVRQLGVIEKLFDKI